MRPVRKVRLSPFLLSITPVLNSHILNYNNHFGKSVEIDGEDYSPFFCEYSLAESIAEKLSSKIPNEEESLNIPYMKGPPEIHSKNRIYRFS